MNVQIKSSSGIALVPLESRLMSDRRIFIEGEIDCAMACEFVKKIMFLNTEDSRKSIDVFINSPGGEINSGMMMYDVLQASNAPIRMFCIGHTYSMGAVLFSSGCHGRYMLPHAELMIHEPLLGSRVGGNSSSIQSVSESLLETKRKMTHILAKHTGKTVSVIEARLLETYHTSIIATVTKRRIVHKYKRLFEERGYDVQDLNFAHPTQGDIGYDPLAYVKSYADISFLSSCIVMANPQKDNSVADPYWDDVSKSLLSAETSYTMMTKPNATFSDVVSLHNSITFEEKNGMIVTSLDRAFERIEAKDPNCFAVSCWKSFKQLPIKTASCVFSTLNTTMDTIFTPELRKLMAMKRMVNFEKFSSKKTILFVTTSPVNPTLNCFVNMFYGHVFKQLFEFAESRPDGTLPIPVHILCDDFATGSRILHFADYISIFREKKISVTLLLQSESQFQAMYGANETTTIINNCDTYLYMGGMDLQTAHNVSIRLNAPLEDVLYMPLGQIVVFRRGQRPVVTTRYHIFEDARYQSISKQYEAEIAGKDR